jgi:hypothetical protein
METTPEQEQSVECSGRIDLECGCGERMMLLGLEEDWQAEHVEFTCRCGRKLTLANRADEEVRAVKKLLRAGMEYRP